MGRSGGSRTFVGALLAVTGASVLAGCCGAQGEVGAPSAVPSPASPSSADPSGARPAAATTSSAWRALFPAQNEGEVRTDRWSDRPVLQIGGRDYASALPSDQQLSVGLALAPLSLREGAPQGLRWAIIGAGSGFELLVALSTEPERVDLYEPRAELHERAQDLLRMSGTTLSAALLLGDGPRNHEAVTTFESPPGGPAPAYDIIVHTAGLTVISEPYRLFRRERLEALAGLLAPEGRLVMHVQLSEISAPILGNLLRTFASAFDHMAVLAPFPGSRDAYVVGARDPLAFHLPSLRQISATDEGRVLRSLIFAPEEMDLASRVLLASRAEVLAFAGDGPVYTDLHPMAADELPRMPPMEAEEPTEADAEAWRRSYHELMARHGFSESFHQLFYDPSWEHGDPCPDPPRCALVTGLGDGREAAALLGDLALARFLWNGRSQERLFSAAREAGGAGLPLRAEQVYVGLTAEEDPPFRASDWQVRGAFGRELAQIEGAFGRGAWSDAARQITGLLRARRVPVDHVAMAEIFWAYASHRAGREGAMASFEEAVERAPSLLVDHPEILLLLGRMRYRAGRRFSAAQTVEAYLELAQGEPASRGGAR